MKATRIIKHQGDTHDLILTNQGSTGFSIQWEISNQDIASVERLENILPENLQAGSPIQTKYRIHFQKRGEVRIDFCETRVWDDTIPKNILAQFLFIVK